MKKGIVNCFAILFTLLGVDKALKVDRLTSLLTDEHNRQVIIHGANFVVK